MQKQAATLPLQQVTDKESIGDLLIGRLNRAGWQTETVVCLRGC